MNNTNIDQALAALADAIKSQNEEVALNTPSAFVKKLPWRSLSGDHINGGKILNFSSTGITDKSTKEQISISDDRVSVKFLSVDKVKGSILVEEEITSKNITADVIKVKVLEAEEIKADIKYEKDTPIVFSGDELHGKGLLWTGHGTTKQFVFANPDKLFSSENLDLAKNKQFSINNIKVLDEKELGPTVTTSNLRQVGRLKGLIVDGSLSVNDFLYFNGTIDRLGLGTDSPNSALSIADNGVEVMIGTRDTTRGMIGTFATNYFDIVTDNTTRLSISPNGDVQIGNKNNVPVQVGIHGSLSINANNPDARAQLHVNGAIKFNDKLHLCSNEPPRNGAFNQGDIVWNSDPVQGRHVGWVCVRGGTPGIWSPFGAIV